ncbi:MAG: hypothetical protein IT350_07705 [Deltaproteobacteria bacterium]|nr:hypothetical protein [Deltaproteobacteria bacterium]
MARVVIVHALAIIALKVATRLPKGWGLYPAGFYVGQALAALKTDDLDRAMEFYRLAVARDFTNDRVRVLGEILANEIRFRKSALARRMAAGDAAAQAGMAVLDGFLAELGATPDQNSTRPVGL